jgi:hypothetical protein
VIIDPSSIVQSDNAIANQAPHHLACPTFSSAKAQRTIIGGAFNEGSYYPSRSLSLLLDDVLLSSFLRENILEPLIGDDYSTVVLMDLIDIPGFPLINRRQRGQSLYTLFIERPSNMCLMCGKPKTSLARALGCVRSHLGHRPFICSGCELCDNTEGYVLCG